MSVVLARPGWLVLLAVLPAWIWWLRPRGGWGLLVARTEEARTVALGRLLGRSIELAPQFLRALGVALLVGALAQPQLVRTYQDPVSQGVGIAVAIDLSTSMGARDLSRRGSRLQVAKETVLRFLEGRTDDVGVVAFGGEALTRMPLTPDHWVVREAVDDLDSSLLLDGTDIASAIAAGAGLLRDAPQRSKVLILVTDGAHNGEGLTPARAARAAAAFGVKIYAIAIGTDYMLRNQLQEMETVLTQAALITGGRYFRATNEEALADAYEEIESLAAPSEELVERTETTPLARWLVLASLPLLVLGGALRGSRWGVLP